MEKYHFSECASTQEYLKNLLQENKEQAHGPILVSAEKQTQGKGRFQNQWHSYQYSLAFSCVLPPQKKITLTSLEIGVLLAKFFHQYFAGQLFLKWPNDLLNAERKKCGGILINYINEQTLIVGIGLNLLSNSADCAPYPYKIPFGYVLKESPEEFFHKHAEWRDDYASLLPQMIYEYLLTHRFESEEDLTAEWNAHCLHLNELVQIIDHDICHQGIFQGIGEQGEALLQNTYNPQEKLNIFSGHLFFVNQKEES